MLDFIRKNIFPFKKYDNDKMLYHRSPLGEKKLCDLQKIIFDLGKSLKVPAHALAVTKVHIHPTNKTSVVPNFKKKLSLKKNRFYVKPKRFIVYISEKDAQILLGTKDKEDKIYEAFKRKDIKTLQSEIAPKKVIKTIKKYTRLSYSHETPDEVKAGLAHEFGHIVKYWQYLERKKFQLNFIKLFLFTCLNGCLFNSLIRTYLRKHENFADNFVHQNPILRRAHYKYFKKIVNVEDASKSFYFTSLKTKLYPIRKLYEFQFTLNKKINSMKRWIRDPHRSNRKRAALTKI